MSITTSNIDHHNNTIVLKDEYQRKTDLLNIKASVFKKVVTNWVRRFLLSGLPTPV